MPRRNVCARRLPGVDNVWKGHGRGVRAGRRPSHKCDGSLDGGRCAVGGGCLLAEAARVRARGCWCGGLVVGLGARGVRGVRGDCQVGEVCRSARVATCVWGGGRACQAGEGGESGECGKAKTTCTAAPAWWAGLGASTCIRCCLFHHCIWT
eukprot:141771-Chlamydomonas_euryale.AAC.2